MKIYTPANVTANELLNALKSLPDSEKDKPFVIILDFEASARVVTVTTEIPIFTPEE